MRLAVLIVWMLCTPTWATIFGEDDRQFFPMNSAIPSPYLSIGRINGCTGTLIGRDLVLTARHCLVFLPTNEPFKKDKNLDFIFYPAMRGGKSQDPTEIIHMYLPHLEEAKDVENTAQDWAIVKLADPIGDKYGWMEVKPGGITGTKWDKAWGKEKAAFTMAGYPVDRNAGNDLSFQERCTLYPQANAVENSARKEILHDCDAAHGASGAPIFRLEKSPEDGTLKPYIYALNSLYYRPADSTKDQNPRVPKMTKNISTSFANAAAEPKFFYQQLQFLRRQLTSISPGRIQMQ